MVRFSEYFSYEESTGRLLCKVKRPGPQPAVGTEVGSVKHDGRYRSVVLFHKRYLVHRIIWEIVNGPIPPGMCIDHIDGNGLNNKMENLRITTLSGNQRNSRLARNSPLGIHGVYPKRYGYSVQCAGAYIGFYTSFLDACCARISAERRMGFHPNHGRK